MENALQRKSVAFLIAPAVLPIYATLTAYSKSIILAGCGMTNRLVLIAETLKAPVA